MTGPSFDDLLAPIKADDFLNAYVGRRTLHVSAPEGVHRKVLDWAGLNRLLEARSHWSDAYLKLVIDGSLVGSDRYCDAVQTLHGMRWRADPAKVQAFLGLGASLVANLADEVSLELKSICETIGERLGGAVTANVYASSKAIGGFPPHYDVTDVLAIHCEGEKVWRLYEGRADNPVNDPGKLEHTARLEFSRGAGKQIDEVRMRPGDMLYIPRGWYHDALATSDASLHVTFAVQHFNARVWLRLVEQAAMAESLFRADLPTDEAARSRHLSILADRLRELALSPSVFSEVAWNVRQLRTRPSAYDLPNRPKVVAYRATGKKIEILQSPTPTARIGGVSVPIAGLVDVALWVSTAAAINDLELYARFKSVSRADLDRFLADIVRLGAFTPLHTGVN